MLNYIYELGFIGYGHVRIYPIIIKNSKQLFTFAKPSESSSVGRASASQAEGRGFESRFSLNITFSPLLQFCLFQINL